MLVHVASRRRKPESVRAAFPGATIVDVTSRASEPWVRLSPFYPHGGIPVPFTPGVVSASVEGIWQALKVFEQSDIDPAKLSVSSMSGLKRTVRRHGPVLGHRAGLRGEALLDYTTARWQIYLPTYLWVLENRVPDLVERLRDMAGGGSGKGDAGMSGTGEGSAGQGSAGVSGTGQSGAGEGSADVNGAGERGAGERGTPVSVAGERGTPVSVAGERGAGERRSGLGGGAAGGGVVLLDYTTNGDLGDTSSPLSHAALLSRYLTGRWPTPATV